MVFRIILFPLFFHRNQLVFLPLTQHTSPASVFHNSNRFSPPTMVSGPGYAAETHDRSALRCFAGLSAGQDVPAIRRHPGVHLTVTVTCEIPSPAPATLH